MTTVRYFLWFALCFAAYLVLILIQRPLRSKSRIVLRIILWVVKGVAVTALSYVILALPGWTAWQGALPMTALYVAVLGDFLSDIIMIPVSAIRKGRPYLGLNTLVCAIVTLAVLLYGTINIKTIRKTEITYTSEKITQEHKFVFISDLHVGSSQSWDTIVKALEEIGELKPDFIVLGGDITDEYTKKEEMEDIYGYLGNMKIPVYFVFGNHDRQPDAKRAGGPFYTEEELAVEITFRGITILDDSWVRISDDLVLLGREDATIPTRESVEELAERPSDAYVVCVDHSPYEKQDIIDTKADLQLSGHTHAGQLFPLQILYNIAGYDAYGKYHYGDTDLYVSSGMGGWSVPYRNEARSEYVVVNLLPAR